jgi:ligand-binding sensor domain-containing protein
MRCPDASLIVVWLALSSCLPAEPSVHNGVPDGFARRVWQTQDSLPENTVQSFAQTFDHYFWIGTTGGLVRFDGVHLTVFDRDNTPALRDNGIFCLTVSRDGTLWMALLQTDGMFLVT